MIGPVDTFKTEVLEHLSSLEEVMLELESHPEYTELINTAFRSIHTIKGSAGMFGYHDLTAFTHHLETVLDQIRKGEIVFSSDLIGVFLDSGDFISGLLEEVNFSDAQKSDSQLILDRLHEIVGKNSSEEVMEVEESQAKVNDGSLACFNIKFTPHSESFKQGLDIFPILREIHGYGSCIVSTEVDSLSDFENYNPEESKLTWSIILVTSEPIASIEDTFMFVDEDWSISIDEKPVDELPLKLKNTLNILSDNVKKSVEKSSVFNVYSKNETNTPTKNNASEPTIRVPASRLDNLMNLVGELVIVQARLNQVAATEYNENLVSISEELDQLTTQMRDQTFSIRMLPIGTTFGKFRRLVRDLSKELSKKIELITIGGETELDKMVIDKLSDPLIHLIRNSIDHGIESLEARVSNNKPETGSIILTARHVDSHVVISIRDDGKGLDTEKIKALAVERGIIPPDIELTHSEMHQLIFEPGFSTAKVISDISGRGVGMDVVKRSIQELGGSISIKSEQGEGTEFSVSLPMTLAIIEGLMVKVGPEFYVLPLSNVEECIEMPSGIRVQNSSKRVVEVRGEQIPFLMLREWFEVAEPRPIFEQIVITQIGEERFGFCVDEVIGQYQTVIKRLGKIYQGAKEFSGATILGDGSVAMILDPAALIEVASREYSENINLKLAK